MNKTGRITLPASIRKLLHIEGEAEFEVEQLEAGDGLVLRPVIVMRREDAWVYTTEMLESIQRGVEDIRQGRVREATEADFRSLAEVADE
jgi:bifunctional DNA-binding transcriptional regulator/antitoxin component of YhaV-PrlF toxin-antitoxin module